MKGRTVVEFPCPRELWPQVESWATETGFSLQSQTDTRRVYRRGNWLLMAPVWVEIRQEGRRAFVEAWLKVDFFLILSLLTGKKPETGIESGGLTAALPRARARDAVNRLLVRFGQPPVV